MTKPTIGRIVHYRSFGTPKGEHPAACRAAIVTGINITTDENGEVVEDDGEFVSLAVLNPTGLFFDEDVIHMESQAGGTWHWPCVQG